ncbi:MAG: hypothetical protein WA477_13620 [Candidatus Sulfotelmatobacter sp.]
MANETETRHHISPGRLWFGFAGSAAAWIGLGLADLLITWQACLGQEQYGGGRLEPGFKLLYLVVTLALLIMAIVAGGVSLRNWRKLSGDRHLADAEGRGREEYMALIGVFISLTLGIGIIWLGLPIAMIELCVRAR